MGQLFHSTVMPLFHRISQHGSAHPGYMGGAKNSADYWLVKRNHHKVSLINVSGWNCFSAFLLFFFFLGVYWSLFLHGDSYTVQFFRFSKGNKTFFHTYNCTKALFYSGTNPVLLYCSLAWFKLNIVACECTSFKSKLDNTVKSHVPCAPDWWIRKTNSHLACYVNTLFSSIFKSRYSYWVWYQQIPHNIYLL